MAEFCVNVVCAFDNKHKFPKVFHVKAGETPAPKETFEAYCPFCGKYVQVTLDKEAEITTKVWKKFGFDTE